MRKRDGGVVDKVVIVVTFGTHTPFHNTPLNQEYNGPRTISYYRSSPRSSLLLRTPYVEIPVPWYPGRQGGAYYSHYSIAADFPSPRSLVSRFQVQSINKREHSHVLIPVQTSCNLPGFIQSAVTESTSEVNGRVGRMTSSYKNK